MYRGCGRLAASIWATSRSTVALCRARRRADPEPNPCPVCSRILEELAALRLALHNAEVDRDVAQMEASSLPHPRYVQSPL